jgi:hypothetical protein
MTMTAPWPEELEDLVGRARAFTGWSFHLEDGAHDDGQVTGLRLLIVVRHYDSYHPERRRSTGFVYPVPAAVYDRASWQRWLFDRCMDLWRHETGEALAFAYRRERHGGGQVEVLERPFAPFHGPGRDPNRNVEVGVDPMEARVRQDGGRYPGWWWDGTAVHDDATHDERCGSPRCTPVQLVGAEA